jgi:DNA-directed RNA polymerase subunit RPC12/RpoP
MSILENNNVELEEDNNTISTLSSDEVAIYICQKCSTNFKNRQTLKLHETTSTKCKSEKSEKDTHKICNFCDKHFSSKQMKKYHENSCIEKIKYDIKIQYDIQMNELKKEIYELKKQYEKNLNA